MYTQSAFGRLMDAALPPPSAVRLCLTVESLPDTGGCASIHEAKPHEINRIQLRKGGAFPHCAAAEPQNTIIIRMPGGLIGKQRTLDIGRWALDLQPCLKLPGVALIPTVKICKVEVAIGRYDSISHRALEDLSERWD